MTTTAASKVRKKNLPGLGVSPDHGNEILGLLLLASVLLLSGSLLSYHPDDPSLITQTSDGGAVRNLIGPFGANLAAVSFAILGLVAFAVPVVLAVYGWRRFAGRSRRGGPLARGLGLLLMLLSLPALCDLGLGEIAWRGGEMAAGGLVGYLVEDVLATYLGRGGALVVLLALALVGISLALEATFSGAAAALRRRLARLRDGIALRRSQRRQRRSKSETRQRVLARHLQHAGRDAAVKRAAEPPPELPPARVRTVAGEGHFSVRRVPLAELAPAPQPPPKAAPRTPGRVYRSSAPADPPPATTQPPVQKSLGFQPGELKPKALPPLGLLDLGKQAAVRDERALVRRGEVIERACREFGVEGTIEGIAPGPVITVFELQPAPGVKVSRIVNLQDDLALALKAESVRIDRIPGRSTLGIEVPNKERSVIHLGRLLADEGFKRAPSPLTLAIGVDLHGRPYYADLAGMPHLLVAGATGAGKSVGLQSMITSILYKATRDQVQFIFIDPKRIELGVYADIPHLKTEVVIEPKKAANALRWAVAEMERRYRLLAEVHVRSIAFYNEAIRDPKTRQRLALTDGDATLADDDVKPLPYYVIVIDELADLMMVAAAEVETSIARLAQMARAVGIHLIIATQRPSVDVLTGTIKANFPCRLSYATATRHDSRTILDRIGAEKLLGKGDALFMPPGTSRLMRLHGAYVSEQETAALVRWLKRQGKPDLDPEVVKPRDGKTGDGGGDGDHDDELYDEAARLVVAERQASASFLQRRMRVGFSRAARLIDLMEQDGLVGPSQGSKPREVLVKPDFFEEIDRAREE
ncbi:MAG: DNA translocase FtsK [Acidobacteria bacterium]|nr:MAG: DNA translocase FtsK [Acidobacteriota bacterium]